MAQATSRQLCVGGALRHARRPGPACGQSARRGARTGSPGGRQPCLGRGDVRLRDVGCRPLARPRDPGGYWHRAQGRRRSSSHRRVRRGRSRVAGRRTSGRSRPRGGRERVHVVLRKRRRARRLRAPQPHRRARAAERETGADAQLAWCPAGRRCGGLRRRAVRERGRVLHPGGVPQTGSAEAVAAARVVRPHRRVRGSGRFPVRGATNGRGVRRPGEVPQRRVGRRLPGEAPRGPDSRARLRVVRVCWSDLYYPAYTANRIRAAFTSKAAA